MLTEQQAQSKYFTKDEAYETIQPHVLIDFKNSAPQSKPTYVYKCSGATYEGFWIGGLRFGKGTMKWSDNTTYIGMWKFGQPTNVGKFTFAGGDVYEGGWANGLCCGFGTLTHKNGSAYSGRWDNGI